MLNTLIYSLRNSELTNAMKKLLEKIMSYQVANNCIIHSEESNVVLGGQSLECKSFR